MKIGIDIRLIGKKRTGDEVVIFNLVREMARLNSTHEFKLFTDACDKETIKKITEQLEIGDKSNFEVVSLETPNRFAWNFWTLPKYLRQNPFDIYHTQYITPWFISHSTKIVTIVHDISFNFFPKFIKFSDLFFLKTLIPISIRRADKIIGVSRFTADEIINYYKINDYKVDWIYNSISKEFIGSEISKEELEKVKEKYALPEKFILYIGTLQPRKNLPMLVEAYARIKNELGGMKVVIGGNRKAHNYDRRIDEAIEKHGLGEDVIFPGFIDEKDKPAIFRLASVFAFPSLYEGFGIPPLEAMSQGVPVICSNIPSLKEIADSGALYFDVESLDDFSKKLYDISMDLSLRKELIRAGNERVSFFSWEKSAAKMLAIYESLLQN
ncbi:MAG: mannosyltransferase B-like protein [uncultured bacterium]|nr:MAG: mannosyltransferase B-like protein [uncultured bacterium]